MFNKKSEKEIIEEAMTEDIKLNKWNKKEANCFRKSVFEELKKNKTRTRLRKKLDDKMKESW
jgi:hypothetical protein